MVCGAPPEVLARRYHVTERGLLDISNMARRLGELFDDVCGDTG
ncbi:hypothetical protein [Pyrodictium abyssi]|uniref:Uncharacterized protein n=1 Tax=Pyrodictium abyssi TaxID=54256 RepID=A0ABM8IZX6_9CREN|nr:hypothetical protein PABY_14880 [Pyrodictium abyssi]